MRGRNWRTYLTVVVLVCAIVALVPPAPALAVDLAAGNCDDSRSSTHYDAFVASNGCDTDDATFWVCTTCWAGGEVYLSVDLGSAEVVGGFRIKTTPGNAGGDGGIYIAYSDNGSSWTNAASQLPQQSAYYTDAGSGASATRTFDYTMDEGTSGAGCLPACGVLDAHRYWRVGTGSGQATAGFRVYSFELDEGETTTVFEDYVYGLRVTHPPFQRQISWWWKQTWSGDWWVTDSDEDELARGADETINTPDYVTVQCLPICGEDTYTIHVQPNGGSEATYEIDGDADGYLIAPSGTAHITFTQACYNATTDDCPDPLDGAADSMYFSFTVERPGTQTVETDITGVMSFGRWDRANVEPCQFVGSPVSSSALSFPATYTQGVSAWDQAAGYFNPAGTQLVLVKWTSSIDAGYYDCKVVGVEIAGGVTTTRQDPQTRIDPCDPIDVACGFGRALDDIFGAAEDVWSDAVTTAHDGMMEKLPFAYIVLALDGINAQLDRAGLEVEASDDCEGVTLPVPLYYGTSPSTPTPTTVPITVLNCASLEPVMGSTWYQAVRGAMDPALWLLFAWAQLKALQPRTSLNG